jgi:hypothetical protein
MIWASNPGRGKRFSPLHTSRLTLKPERVPVFFTGVKWSGLEVGRLVSLTLDVKNEWSYTYTSPIRLLGVYMGDFILPLAVMYLEIAETLI